MKETLYYALFPKKCPACGNLTSLERGFCETCESRLPFIGEEICLHCGAEQSFCVCKKEKNKYESVIAPFYYEGPVQKALVTLKQYPIYADLFARSCFETIRKHYDSEDLDCVCAVPMHRARERESGFNHSAKLAALIAEKLGVPYMDLLEVLYDTPSQHTLGYAMRSGNVRGIYEVKAECADWLEGKTVLLVDDIKTSGATLNECALMLRLGGAAGVKAVVAALKKEERQKETM